METETLRQNKYIWVLQELPHKHLYVRLPVFAKCHILYEVLDENPHTTHSQMCDVSHKQLIGLIS